MKIERTQENTRLSLVSQTCEKKKTFKEQTHTKQRLKQWTYFGLEEGLRSFHSLGGDVDLRETCEDAEAAVLCQLSCCRLPEDQQELMGGAETWMRRGERLSH